MISLRACARGEIAEAARRGRRRGHHLPLSGSATPTTATSATLARLEILDLARAQAVAGDVDDVVGAAEDNQ
jgi:hypothetical protein